jgi:hypothetical protein
MLVFSSSMHQKLLTKSATLLNIDCSKLTMGAVIGLAFLYGVKKYTAKEDVLADKDPAPKYGFY